MKYVIVGLTLILAACSSTVSNNEQASSASADSSSADLQSDLNHKILCAQYLASAKQALAADDKKMSWAYATQITSLGKMFWSNKRNSCVYSWEASTYVGKGPPLNAFGLTDALTGELIVSALSQEELNTIIVDYR